MMHQRRLLAESTSRSPHGRAPRGRWSPAAEDKPESLPPASSCVRHGNQPPIQAVRPRGLRPPRADVLVTNAGFGAIQLALAAGVPIVAAGKTEDKVEVAARVGWSGVGINLRTQRPRQESITAAVRQVLRDDRFRQRAHELQAEIVTAGREQGAAEELEKLCSAVADRRDHQRLQPEYPDHRPRSAQTEPRLELPVGTRLAPEPGVGDFSIAARADVLPTSHVSTPIIDKLTKVQSS